jgi:hypothetical protein
MSRLSVTGNCDCRQSGAGAGVKTTRAKAANMPEGSRAVIETAFRTMPSSQVIPLNMEIHSVRSPAPVFAISVLIEKNFLS